MLQHTVLRILKPLCSECSDVPPHAPQLRVPSANSLHSQDTNTTSRYAPEPAPKETVHVAPMPRTFEYDDEEKSHQYVQSVYQEAGFLYGTLPLFHLDHSCMCAQDQSNSGFDNMIKHCVLQSVCGDGRSVCEFPVISSTATSLGSKQLANCWSIFKIHLVGYSASIVLARLRVLLGKRSSSGQAPNKGLSQSLDGQIVSTSSIVFWMIRRARRACF